MIFRTATLRELAEVLDWAADEGWNPGLDDAVAFHATDPEGFFVAVIDSRPVAAISVVNHSPDQAFLGLYLCQPEFRGQGIGFSLWQYALDHAGGRTVGLDGVAAQEANYAKSGFVKTGATRRFEGTLQGASDPSIRPAQLGDFARLSEIDSKANGFRRDGFLASWTKPTAHRLTLCLTEGATVTGFATFRACRTGLKAGPVIAPTATDALAMLNAGMAAFSQAQLAVDLPESSADLADILTQEGFTNAFTTARMYRGPAPEMGPTLQAIATMELG